MSNRKLSSLEDARKRRWLARHGVHDIAAYPDTVVHSENADPERINLPDGVLFAEEIHACCMTCEDTLNASVTLRFDGSVMMTDVHADIINGVFKDRPYRDSHLLEPWINFKVFTERDVHALADVFRRAAAALDNAVAASQAAKGTLRARRRQAA